MSNTFNFKRFGKYLCHDLMSAWQNAGVSVITVACMPLWFFAIYELFCLVFKGSFGTMSTGLGIAAVLVSFFLAVIFFPVQIYGKVTDKRPGSNYLMLPASAFEKTLSMLIVLCVALPLIWVAIISANDLLLSLTGIYNGPVVESISGGIEKMLAEFHTENMDLAIGGPYALYLSWCADALAFALGAILFRKNKIVYTFLSLMGIGILITIVIGLIANGFNFDFNLGPEDINEDSLMRLLNIIIYSLYVIEFAVLDLGIYFRIKTLKH